MTTNASKALHFETEFLSGVAANLEAAKGKHLTGSQWDRTEHDDDPRMRSLMATHHNYDRELLKSMPTNRRVAIHGYERRWLFLKRKTGVATASVLSPLSHYARSPDSDGPPIDLGELTEHVRELTADKAVRHVVGICSPTGFTDEARNAALSSTNAQVVLVEPDGHGGWRATAAGEGVDPRVVAMFDPEGVSQKVERVAGIVEQHSADLLTGGLSVSSVVEETHLPVEVVKEGFRQIAKADPELRITEKAGEVLMYRGAPARHQERQSMNVIDKIKSLFAGDGDEGDKINVLAERRAALAERRKRIYEDIGKLEKKEAQLLEEGKASKSQVPRRRLAAQLMQLRKDIGRQNTSAAMLNKQINIISTDIHNLTLIQQGEMAQLPDTTELTEHAVEAEEMLETLNADADMVGSLETGMEQSLTSEEELAIMQEFEGADEQPSKAERAAPTAQASSAPAATERVAETPPATPAPDGKMDDGGEKSRSADPEAS
ncbi:MAG: hypothetical protein IIB57_04940 [Planctomycetes bacterium]|nr:hypothetical protein [Planctomycetota bacterium]